MEAYLGGVGRNCTLLQILVRVSACAICKCVQCARASSTAPKGRSGRSKTNFFLQYLSISAIIFFLFFQFSQSGFNVRFGLLHLADRVAYAPLRTVRATLCIHDFKEYMIFNSRNTAQVLLRPSRRGETRLLFYFCYR
ncbi:MAG: hypothetical protein PWQ06_1238 [Anaerophaga sp.]|nr:hypothetical protein [Anaerophaga sp.]